MFYALPFKPPLTCCKSLEFAKFVFSHFDEIEAVDHENGDAEQAGRHDEWSAKFVGDLEAVLEVVVVVDPLFEVVAEKARVLGRNQGGIGDLLQDLDALGLGQHDGVVESVHGSHRQQVQHQDCH